MTSSMPTKLAHKPARCTPGRKLLLLAPALLLGACTGLSQPQVPSQNIYMLETAPAIKPASTRRNLVLAVSTPRARPGFETPQIAYVQQPYELSYFVTARWAAAPVRMLEPLLLQALEQTGGFRAVVQTAGTVPADLILEIELTRLQQNFDTKPSHVQLGLRAQLIDVRNKRMLAVKLFDGSENAGSDDVYGGVTAANRLVQRMLGQLADFAVSESAVQ